MVGAWALRRRAGATKPDAEHPKPASILLPHTHRDLPTFHHRPALLKMFRLLEERVSRIIYERATCVVRPCVCRAGRPGARGQIDGIRVQSGRIVIIAGERVADDNVSGRAGVNEYAAAVVVDTGIVDNGVIGGLEEINSTIGRVIGAVAKNQIVGDAHAGGVVELDADVSVVSNNIERDGNASAVARLRLSS